MYGYFPCNSAGDDLIVFDPEDQSKEIERFTFPRQAKRERLCISDFFRPIESGEKDVVGFHCVTMGVEVSHRAKQLFERNDYTEYLYLHGMGVETRRSPGRVLAQAHARGTGHRRRGLAEDPRTVHAALPRQPLLASATPPART